MHKIIEDLNWRYATKKFDPTLKLSEEQLEIIMESLRLTASSFGLQAYKIFLIENPELRRELTAASYGQTPVSEASHLFIFCANTKVSEEDVSAYMSLISQERNVPSDNLQGFANGIQNSVNNMSSEQLISWTTKQTYIALGQLMNTCAALRVDCLPMEGFDSFKYDQILGLETQNLTATLVCPVGFRHKEDASQHKKKVRKARELFFEFK